MDKEFQTTFIPKKPLTEDRVTKKVSSRPLGIFTMISTLIFIVTILIGVGLYFFNGFMKKQIATSQVSLERAEAAFEPSLILELQELDTRLRVADTLLTQHIAVSPIFRILEGATLPSVQFNNFKYAFEGGQAKVALSGLARRYQTIAEQSLLLGEDRFVTEHIFSNFSLNEEGRVAFNLDLSVSPELIYFTRSLGEISQEDVTETETEIETTEEATDISEIPDINSIPLLPNSNPSL